MSDVSFTLNGRPVQIRTREGETLLEALRGRCGVVSTKDGCAPQGQCGCCVAVVDGAAKTTCAMSADKVAGREVLTLEGLPQGERELIARSFVTDAVNSRAWFALSSESISSGRRAGDFR